MPVIRNNPQTIAAAEVSDDLNVELTVRRGTERIVQTLSLAEAHQLAGELAGAAHEARRYQLEEPTA